MKSWLWFLFFLSMSANCFADNINSKESQAAASVSGRKLYQLAQAKLKLSKDEETNVNMALKSYIVDEKVLTIISNNQEAMDLFKKATQQNSDGFIFGKKPIHMNETKTPIYGDYLLLNTLIIRNHIKLF